MDRTLLRVIAVEVSMKKTEEAGIYLKSSGKFQVRVTVKCPSTGKRTDVQKTLPQSATMQDAIALRSQLRGEVISELVVGDQPTTTLADYVEQWISRKAKRLKKSTMTKNFRVLSHHVLPVLGHVRLDSLHRRDVSGWIAWAEHQRRADGEPYSDDTVASWWRVLRNVLRDAYADGYVSEDVTYRHTPPRTGVSGRQEKETLTGNQLGELIEAAYKYTPTRYAEIVSLAYTGMRIGEAYALTWDDVDLASARISVNASVWRGSVGTTKTGAGREVPIPDLVVSALTEHRQAMIRNQHPGLDLGLVFPADHGGYRESSSLRKPLQILAEHCKFGQRVTPQVLRRTYNTLMLQAQVDRIVLRSIIGHSSESMTQRYAGVGIESKRLAISAAFGGSCGASGGTSPDGVGGADD
jgi:integrase